MIKKVSTTFFIQEEETDGHRPMKFECNDGAIYYCKYLNSLKPIELDCLAYEVVAHYLLKALQIPTPEIALVTLTADSFNPKHLKKYNKKYAKEGIVCFGSKSVDGANLVNDTQLMLKRREFNRYENTHDLIKIAFFDLWLDNCDRGRDGNINLIEAPIKEVRNQNRYYAIDHAFIFGNLDRIRIFNPKNEISTNRKLLENEYFKSVIKFIPPKQRVEIVNNFVALLNENYINALQTAFSVIPDSWQVPKIVMERIHNFVSDPKRLKLVEFQVNKKLKKK